MELMKNANYCTVLQVVMKASKNIPIVFTLIEESKSLRYLWNW